MKTILYFILSVITIIFVGFLCYVNIVGLENVSLALNYVAVYGGLVIALAYAAINFFGNPLKTVLFIILVVMVIVLIFTLAIPDSFRSLFGINGNPEGTQAIFGAIKLFI